MLKQYLQGQFISIAERKGLIKNLDHWVMKSVLKQIKFGQIEGKLAVKGSIKVAAETVESVDF